VAPKSVGQVLGALERLGGFASAQEVYQSMQVDGGKIGLTTVYRSLQTLVDDEKVDLLRRDNGEAIYRLCGDAHHHHLICKKCGRTEEITGGAIENWARKIAMQYGFRDVGHTAELFGTCSIC
jgi:Fur family ferric uptake transcriptional regulator